MPRNLIAFVAAACVAAASNAPRAQQAAFRAGTDTVSIYATVVDRNGRLVPDLTEDDFQVFDNGRPQPLTIFKNDTQPITIVVMLDRSGSMASNSDIVTRAAESFVASLLPQDKARLGTFSSDIRIEPTQFTSDRDELLRVLRARVPSAGPTPLWNATSTAMDALAGETGRRVVLVFTDGYDSPDKPAGNVTLEQVVSRSQVDEIMVYAIGLGRMCEGDVKLAPAAPRTHAQRGGRVPRGGFPRPPVPIPVPGGRFPIPRTPPTVPGYPPPDVPIGGHGGSDAGRTRDAGPLCLGVKPDPGLRTLADEGGGGYFELRRKDDLAATFTRVADELHQQYLLGFKAPELDGSLHRIEVRLRNSSLVSRARKSYMAAAAEVGSR